MSVNSIKKDVLLLHYYIHLTDFFQDNLISRHQKGKPFWVLMMQEMMGGSGISWTICKSAPHTRHITSTPPLSFYRPDAFPTAQPTASNHWRQRNDI